MWEKRLHPENKNKKTVIKETTEKEKNLLLWNKEKKTQLEKKFSESIFRTLNKLSKYWAFTKQKEKILEGKKWNTQAILKSYWRLKALSEMKNFVGK